MVVTGLGPVSKVGMDQASFFQGLLDGKTAIDTVSRFDVSEYTCQIAAEVRGIF